MDLDAALTDDSEDIGESYLLLFTTVPRDYSNTTEGHSYTKHFYRSIHFTFGVLKKNLNVLIYSPIASTDAAGRPRLGTL
jgi:hypothetical protein